ncbi:MAG TPA: hypothetical protein VEZ14_09900 [Dehalococcoidia bacterium]|nr:hypothetical protein [Dehalococcoidia bacterium]
MKMLRGRSIREGREVRRTAKWWIVQALAFLGIWATGPLIVVFVVGPKLGVVGPEISFGIACAIFYFYFRGSVPNSP